MSSQSAYDLSAWFSETSEEHRQGVHKDWQTAQAAAAEENFYAAVLYADSARAHAEGFVYADKVFADPDQLNPPIDKGEIDATCKSMLNNDLRDFLRENLKAYALQTLAIIRQEGNDPRQSARKSKLLFDTLASHSDGKDLETFLRELVANEGAEGLNEFIAQLPALAEADRQDRALMREQAERANRLNPARGPDLMPG